MNPMIHAHDVHKRFGALEVLKGVSLDIAKGEVVAVIGPSGSGKSTFLRCLNHLETINRGRIVIEGETLVASDVHGVCHYVPEADIRRICVKMGMVFQHFNLFPHLTVLQNVLEAPLTVKGLKREAVLPKAEEACPNGLAPTTSTIITVTVIARTAARRPRWSASAAP